MQRRYATRDNERQLQGGGQRGQYRREYDDEAMQREFSGYDQEDEYGMQPSRERGEWQADWSESGRARGDDSRYERNERYGSRRDSRDFHDSRESRYGNPRQLDGQGDSRDPYGRSQGGMQGRDVYGARSGFGGGYGRDSGRQYSRDFGRDYEGDYGGDFGNMYGRDRSRDYERDNGNGMSQGYGQQHRYGDESWQGRQEAGQRGYGAYGGGSTDMRHREGPKGYSRTDERVREDVCERLCMAHHLEVCDVSVQVKDGRVELQGNVPQRWMKHAIEDVVEKCFGVHDVENRIRTQAPQHAQGDQQRGGTSGSSGAQRTSGQSGTVGTAGSTTVSSATGSTGSSSGTSGTSSDSGKHH